MERIQWNVNDLHDSSLPLKSLANTSETLSVKQTHIGVNDNGGDNYPNDYPNNLLMVQEYSKSAQSSSTSGHYQINEIVQYPPDIISTTVEKSNVPNWGYQSREAILRYKHNHQRYSKSKLKTLPFDNHTDPLQFRNDTECSDNSHDNDRQSLVESDGSTVSGYTGIESIADILQRDHYDTNSIAIQSDSCVMINEYVQTSVIDDGSDELFVVKRENAGLKGQLEQLDFIMEEMVKERSELQIKIHSLEKDIKVKSERITDLNSQNQHFNLINDELKLSINKWESIVCEYRDVIEEKTNEVNAYTDDIKHVTSEYERIKIAYEHLKIDLESKNNHIKEFEKKIELMSDEFKTAVQNKINADEEIKKIKNENDSIVSRNQWYDGELSKMQIKLNEMQQRVVHEQEECLKLKSSDEKCQMENCILKQQLNEVKHRAVKEKELLMKHLETIGADLLAREVEVKWNTSYHGDSLSLLKTNQDTITSLKEEKRIKDMELEMLRDELNQIKQNNDKSSRESQTYTNEITLLKKQIYEKQFELNSSDSYKSDLEFKIKGLNIDLKRQREFIEIIRRDKNDSDNKVATLVYDNKTLESATRQLKETIEQYERNLKQLQSNIIAKETKLDMLEKEKSKLNDSLMTKDQELNQIKQSFASASVNGENEMSFRELQIQKNELEMVMNALNTELRSINNKYESEKKKVLEENSDLQLKLNDQMKNNESLREKIDLMSKENQQLISELQIKNNENVESNCFIQKESAVKESESKEHNELLRQKDEKIRVLESNVKLLTRKYKEAIQRYETEMKLNNTNESIPKFVSFASTQTDKYENRSLIDDLKQEIERFQNLLKGKELIIEENMKVILNLEHEKGKLLTSGDNSTKQHITSLEALITSKTEETTELNEKLRESTARIKDIETKMNKKITEIENDLKNERAVVKDLRHSIFTEKRQNSYLKRDLNELKTMLNDSNKMADKRQQQVIDIENEFKEKKDIELSLRNEITKINTELKYSKEENVKLKLLIDESSTKNGPLLDQLKSLSLNLMEKNQEINAIKSSSSAAKERYDIELQGLRQLNDNYQSDMSSINEELIELRKEKFNLLSKLAELRVALRNSHDMNKRMKDQLKCCEIGISNESSFNEEHINQLLSQSYQTSMESAPLLNLQACVESLKQEMEVLQKQIVH